MSKPLRADAERNRQRLLAAARDVFAEQGLGAGLDVIAARAGVGVGTAYRRFPDKALLIEALFEQGVDELVSGAERALTAADPWDGLVEYMHAAVERHASDRGLRELVFAGAGGPERLARVRERLAPLVEEIAARAQASGRLRADIAPPDLPLLQFMLAGLSSFHAPEDLTLWRRALGIVLDGLSTPAPTPLDERPLTPEEFAAALSRR